MFLLLVLAVRANIWDNIFANQDAPEILIPNDFHVQLGLSPISSQYTMDLNYSSKFRAAHLIAHLGPLEVLNAYANLSNSEITINGVKCQSYIGPSLGQAFSQQSGNQDLIVEPGIVFQLISRYEGTNDDNLSKFEVTSLLEGSNKVYAYFKDGELHSVELDIDKKHFKLYVTQKLEERVFQQSEFVVPWTCEKSKIPVTRFEEIFTKYFH